MTDSNEGMTPRRRATPAQAEARRANGKKSRGPTSASGKARSRQNALRHGGYERVLGLIQRGPLREDPRELEDLREQVFDSVPSVATPLLAELAGNVAEELFRRRRERRFVALAVTDVSGYGGAHGQDPLDWADSFTCAQIVVADETYPERPITDAVGGMWVQTVRVLLEHPDLKEGDSPFGPPGQVIRLTFAEFRDAALTLIDKIGAPRTELLAWLRREEGDHRQASEEQLIAAGSPAAYRALGDPIMATATRLETHQTRQIDRALKAYYEELARFRSIERDGPEDEEESRNEPTS